MSNLFNTDTKALALVAMCGNLYTLNQNDLF